MIAARLISLAIGYCFGMILIGYLLGKLAHIDIRKEGSGNVGTTNATRVLGAKAGLITLIFDISKGLVAAGVVWLLFRSRFPDDIRLLMVYASFGSMIGHDFPVYLGFKGGKGVATGIAFFFVTLPPGVPLLVLAFIIIVAVTKYVSLASITGAVLALIEIFVFDRAGLLDYKGGQLTEVVILVAAAVVILIVKHRANIGRLIAGTENRFSLHK